MAYLTIAGVTYLVAADGAAEIEPLEVGQEEPAFLGNLISMISDEKRRWQFTLVELSESAYQTLRTNTRAGAHVTVAGDLMPASLTCRVKVSNGPMVRERPPAAATRTASITVMEV